ncbi:AMP-binding protein [Bacillus sp. V5-8f]|uniref:AMP-binding protein n=1 Tax=Bacillus sp. V5-8f TaxID=2053044 RepID=UPI002154FB33|nr:AMP-binding protein [Bacillus sp. V5-8f]
MAAITETYAKHAELYPEKVAIHTDNQLLSYYEWHELICKTANWLDSIGDVNKRLAIFMPNSVPFLQLFAGASMAGWIAIPFDMKWKEEEIEKRLSLSQPSVLITTRDMHRHLNHLHPDVRIWDDCEEEMNQAAVVERGTLEGNTPFYMGFTSGTTGNPKAFIRSHESWVESFHCNRFDFHIDETDHVLIPGPFIFSHFLYGAISTLYLGGTVYVLEKFSPFQVLSFIHTYPITIVYLVPTMIEALRTYGHTTANEMKFISSGAKWEENSKLAIRKLFPNMSMYEFYGASELSFVSVLTDDQNNQKPGSVGKPCHNVELQIRRADMSTAEPNQVGKIYVRSNMLFTGYLDNDYQSIQPIRDENGWATVDDMGYLDEDGFLYISGREKNMILYGGINIFPEEIEKVISLHPDVDEVAVIGLEDRYWGQVAAAVIKGNATKTDLRNLCRTKLSSYKIPRKWYFVDEMPHTTSGKIARAKLKESLEQEVKSH